MSSTAIRRLRKEFQQLQAHAEFGLVAAPLDANVLEWHFVLYGSADTPYQGGLYHGKLVFPSSFPMKPPAIMMLTESGRFAVNKKICMSMSDFHPELWSPTWGVRTILVALLSFMNSEELTTGGLGESDVVRKDFARRSLEAIKRDVVVLELFPDIIKQADEYSEYMDRWPPPGLLPLCATVPLDASARPSEELSSLEQTSSAAARREAEVCEDNETAAARREAESCEDNETAAAARRTRTAKSNARKRAKAKAAKEGAGVHSTTA